LIHAIAHEGEANRAEGKAEDRGRKFRELITILLLIATTLGVYWQIHEMIKVYEPIAEQAHSAEENRIADQRAWIGVVGANADPFVVTSPATPIGTTIFYADTGREPARLSISSHEFTFPGDTWSNRKFPIKIMEWHDECFAIHDKFDTTVRNGQATRTSVAFPTLGQNWWAWYSPPPKDGAVVADDDVISGRKVIIILAYFMYTSVDVVRHTTFCGVDVLGKEVSTTFSLCPVGNDAD
jgi:hypothetical protein